MSKRATTEQRIRDAVAEATQAAMGDLVREREHGQRMREALSRFANASHVSEITNDDIQAAREALNA